VGPEPPAPQDRAPRVPWREAVLLAGLLLLGWPVALLAFAFPFAVFLAYLDRRRRWIAAGALGAAIPVLLALLVPGSRFFVLAAVLALAAGLSALRWRARVGYPELSLCVLAGLALAAAVWLFVEPGFFTDLRASLESSTLAQGRRWLARIAEGGDLDARTRVLLEQAVAASAELAARSWPAATFAALWLGSGAALAFAARRGPGGSAVGARVRVAERCSRFRLPDLWVWVFLVAVGAFLLAPRGGAIHDAALNVALSAAGLYAWQGIAIALYYLERRGVRPAGRLLLFAGGLLLLPLPVLVTALCLGLADVKLDLRSRKGGNTPATPRV